jgi:hypothetical protein
MNAFFLTDQPSFQQIVQFFNLDTLATSCLPTKPALSAVRADAPRHLPRLLDDEPASSSRKRRALRGIKHRGLQQSKLKQTFGSDSSRFREILLKFSEKAIFSNLRSLFRRKSFSPTSELKLSSIKHFARMFYESSRHSAPPPNTPHTIRSHANEKGGRLLRRRWAGGIRVQRIPLPQHFVVFPVLQAHAPARAGIHPLPPLFISLCTFRVTHRNHWAKLTREITGTWCYKRQLPPIARHVCNQRSAGYATRTRERILRQHNDHDL